MIKLFKFVCFALVLLGLLPVDAFAAKASISQIRFGKQSNKTIRFVAHLDKKVDTSVFLLDNPQRIVLDFNGTAVENKVAKNVQLPASLIEKVRFGQSAEGEARIVLEVSSNVEFADGFFLAPKKKGEDWRFVLDITDVGNKKVFENSTTTATKTEIVRSSAPVSSSPVKKLSSKPIIVLDPGHGGADPGAISATGRYEKDLTLQMSKEIKAALEKTGRYTVHMTRETDKALTLRGRMVYAHQKNADLFISVHADSSTNRSAKGLSVYTISERASDREAQMLADRENKADIILGMDLSNETPEVSNILIDLAKRDTMEKSSHYANILVSEMTSEIRLVKDAHRFAGFVVLKSTNVPSVLLEIGYLSNKDEERLLRQAGYRAKLVKSTVGAINRYFDTIYE